MIFEYFIGVAAGFGLHWAMCRIRKDSALRYAKNLATTMWERDWKQESPNWQPLDDTVGVLTQIDNMVAGMEKRAKLDETIS